MNRNTWIIIICVIVIIGLIWIFNRGVPADRETPQLASPYDTCLASYPKAYDYCASKVEKAF